MGQNQALQSLRLQKRHLGCQLEVQLVEESLLEGQWFKLQKLLSHAPRGRLTLRTILTITSMILFHPYHQVVLSNVTRHMLYMFYFPTNIALSLMFVILNWHKQPISSCMFCILIMDI